jgi:hypothetical protein
MLHYEGNCQKQVYRKMSISIPTFSTDRSLSPSIPFLPEKTAVFSCPLKNTISRCYFVLRDIIRNTTIKRATTKSRKITPY